MHSNEHGSTGDIMVILASSAKMMDCAGCIWDMTNHSRKKKASRDAQSLESTQAGKTGLGDQSGMLTEGRIDWVEVEEQEVKEKENNDSP